MIFVSQAVSRQQNIRRRNTLSVRVLLDISCGRDRDVAGSCPVASKNASNWWKVQD
jgi:hypothetical protein